jgi:hypothetical protein
MGNSITINVMITLCFRLVIPMKNYGEIFYYIFSYVGVFLTDLCQIFGVQFWANSFLCTWNQHFGGKDLTYIFSIVKKH